MSRCFLKLFYAVSLIQFFLVTVRGDFEGPYSLTPPIPGTYTQPAGGSMVIGTWRLFPIAGGVWVDTTAAPGTLILDTGGSRPFGGWFYFTAPASGTVRFKYTISGSGVGGFGGYGQFAGDSGLITNLVSEPTEASFVIEEGKQYGFSIYAGAFDSTGGHDGLRHVTITDFSGPAPPPDIRFTAQPIGYRVAPGQQVTLSAMATFKYNLPLSYQWEKNGMPIPDATGASINVHGGAAGSTNTYRVRAKWDLIETYSAPAEIVAVRPPEPRLLLHLDFEDSPDGYFSDTAGNFPIAVSGTIGIVPGRIGSYAAEFTDTGLISDSTLQTLNPTNASLSIAAAGTDLELVGTSYTIAWWMRTTNNWGDTIFRLGGAGSTELSGYEARIYPPGLTTEASLTFLSRNKEFPSYAVAPITNTWQHCAIVYDRTNLDLYINGFRRTSVFSPEGPIGTGRDDLLINPFSNRNGEAPLGSIDDFRVYNYALNAAEVAALATAPLPPPSLTISQDVDMVVISWPVEYGTTVPVEFTTSLDHDAIWTPVTNQPTVSANVYEVGQRPLAAGRYYRIGK